MSSKGNLLKARMRSSGNTLKGREGEEVQYVERARNGVGGGGGGWEQVEG